MFRSLTHSPHDFISDWLFHLCHFNNKINKTSTMTHTSKPANLTLFVMLYSLCTLLVTQTNLQVYETIETPSLLFNVTYCLPTLQVFISTM